MYGRTNLLRCKKEEADLVTVGILSLEYVM